MLEGKFKVINVDNYNKNYLKEVGVISFENGECKESKNIFGVHDIEHFKECWGVTVEPVKEYLTISELEEGKVYKVKENDRFAIVDEDKLVTVNEDGSFDSCHCSYNSVINMQFTEVNPNQERIDKLNEFIELEKQMIELGKTRIENYMKELEDLR